MRRRWSRRLITTDGTDLAPDAAPTTTSSRCGSVCTRPRKRSPSCGAGCRRARGRVQALEERLLETKGQLAQAISQNEKLTFTLQQAKEHMAEPARGGREAHPAAGGLRHLPRRQRRRHRRRLLGRPQDAGGAAPRHRPGDHPQRGNEVVLNESLNVVLAREGEGSGEVVVAEGAARGRAPRHRLRPGRRGAGGRALRRPARRASSGPATPC